MATKKKTKAPASPLPILPIDNDLLEALGFKPPLNPRGGRVVMAVLDANGDEVELAYNAEEGLWVEPIDAPGIQLAEIDRFTLIAVIDALAKRYPPLPAKPKEKAKR